MTAKLASHELVLGNDWFRGKVVLAIGIHNICLQLAIKKSSDYDYSMDMTITIQPVTESDVPAAGMLMEEMWREHGEESTLIDMHKILAPTGSGYIRDFLSKPGSRVFVAKDGSRVVGVVSCLLQPLPAHYKETKEVYIDDLCVDGKYRRHGVGSKLVGECEVFARHEGVNVLSAKVWTFNAPSAALLERSGYANDYSYFHKIIRP